MNTANERNKMSVEFLLTSSIDPIQKGQFFPNGPLPRHITIQQWFSLKSEEAVMNSLQNYATTLKPFEVVGGEEALFGPENNVPVRRIQNEHRLLKIHADTLEIITRIGGGALANADWAGEGYKPHITYVDGEALEEDEPATLRTIELIKREDSVRKVQLVLAMSNRA